MIPLIHRKYEKRENTTKMIRFLVELKWEYRFDEVNWLNAKTPLQMLPTINPIDSVNFDPVN